MLTYEQALRVIFSRTNYEHQDRPPYAERFWRLDRMREVLQQLGNPQDSFRSVHIAGTKGKGSTTAMIEAILRAAGYRTGMYTSPHLHTFRERIRVAGQIIPEQDVCALVERLQPVLQTRPDVTVFEIITAMAMWYFAEQAIDIGVFEVGLGGRLDATNVLRPLVSVITSISLDHTKVLGDTVEAIAREKGGIIKLGVPVVTAPQQPGAMQTLEEIAKQQGSPATVVGRDWFWSRLRADLSGQRFAVYRAGHETTPEYPDLHIPLLGAHQLENACTAVAAAETLRSQGVNITPEAVALGLARVEWAGRLEILAERPLVVVDGAHNPYSAQRLLEALREHLQYRRLLLVFGASATHTPQDQLAVLLPATNRLYLTRSQHAKATPIPFLHAMAIEQGHEAVEAETVRKALQLALEEAHPDDLIVVTGSLFVVAEAREAWYGLNGLPPLPSDPPGVYDVPVPAPKTISP
ncbi:MAG: bifunctional folylpolyglutamate synthase/dihydrofolate synthase [Chloroflexi bacterium]|nr:bifunctional folylpolyglutamate synthase/dihydrofolate synthase [Chloroflexota bacterium]